MEPRKLPSALVTALSLAAQGCVASVCLSVKPPDSGTETHTGDVTTGPCLSVVPAHSGDTAVGPCLSPPPPHTGAPTGDTAPGGSGAGGSGSTRLDVDGVLDRLPPDVRARVRGP
jgi:hypothetical protein